jgi:hypothetical protein
MDLEEPPPGPLPRPHYSTGVAMSFGLLPTNLTPAFCTDEDIAARFRSDYPLLCDRENLAAGTDGAFSAGSWTMTSPSNTFDTQGVARGNVLRLIGPAQTFGSAGLLFAVDSALGSTVTARRINMGVGNGLPPAQAAPISGVTFTVPTLSALIELASYDIEKRFGINDLISGRTTANLFDPREVRDVCVLTVVSRRYFDLARQADKGSDLYYAKAATTKQELTDLLDRVTVHWAGVPLPMAETSRFGTRIER